jgi:N-ethylmaleimide reductase
MSDVNLFTPGRIAGFETRNRIIMAPMTRSRAKAVAIPSEIAVEYYSQRASAGLIISEGTAPSPAGLGYARTPSIHTAEHIAAWKKITDAVHARGGRMFLQLMHVGRIGHSANRLSKDPLVAPSAIRAAGQIFTDAHGLQDIEAPRALETDEIPRVIAEYGESTRNALAAGFDGVELHCASGYLPMQFLSSGTNRRTDQYGGRSVKNRIRFVVETLEEMVAAARSSSKIGIKISPAMPFNDVTDDNPVETYTELTKAISPMNLSYLHVLRSAPLPNIFEILRPLYEGFFATVGGFTRETGNAALASGLADFIVYGKLFTSNPDLPERFARNLPLNEWDTATFYSPGPKGYIDFQPWKDEVTAAVDR